MTARQPGRLGTVARVLVGLQLFLSIGALGGAAMLLVAPDGSALGVPLSVLDHSGFRSFLIPGLVLLVVNGVLPMVSAIALLRRLPWAAGSAMAVGVLLTGWIAVEVVMMRSFDVPSHGTYLVLGLAISGLGLALQRSPGRDLAGGVQATAQERHRALPGDALLDDPESTVMHAITIDAPVGGVWPWLAQMGAGRAGWYSHDRVDNGGRPSATTIVPELQHLASGDVLPSLPGVKDSFLVAAVVHERDLILTVPGAGASPLVTWEFFLEPLDGFATRLLVRGRVSSRWPQGGTGQPPAPLRPIERVYALLARMPRWLMAPVARLGHGSMQARQLRGIQQRAEALYAQRTPGLPSPLHAPSPPKAPR